MRSQILFCIVITILSITLVSCDEIRRTVTHKTRETENMEKALSFFVEDNQIMTKRDALAKEIDYYQDPTILRQEFIGNLSGKSLIHIANEIQKEDQNQIGFGPSNIRFFRNVEDIKEYGINHPDEQVAQVYVFGGDFVHYNRGKTEKWEIVVYIPKLDRLISVAGRHIKDIYSDIDLNSDNYKWFWSLPIYNDKPLN